MEQQAEGRPAGLDSPHTLNKTSLGRVTEWKSRTNANIGQVHVTFEDAIADGDRVVVQTVYCGHLQGAPTPFRVPMVTVLRLRDGLIVDDADYYILADVLRLSGLPPDWKPPPPR